LFETKLHCGSEIKEQSQAREPEDTLPQCLDGRQASEAVVERKRVKWGPTEKLKQQSLSYVGVWWWVTPSEDY
jgi:hypothetical protein